MYAQDASMTIEQTGPYSASNQTGRGMMVLTDKLRGPSVSRNVTEAHFKALKLFRRACRMVPWVLAYNAMNYMTNEAAAKVQMARFWRVNSRIRDTSQIDGLVASGYERLGNLHMGDIWRMEVYDYLAPQGRGSKPSNMGYSFAEKKYEKKSKFLKEFYTSPLKPYY